MERKKKPGFVRYLDLLQVNGFIYRYRYCLPFSSVKNSVLQYCIRVMIHDVLELIFYRSHNIIFTGMHVLFLLKHV